MTFRTIHFLALEFTHAHNCDVFGVRDRPIFPRGLSGLTHALVLPEALLAEKCSRLEMLLGRFELFKLLRIQIDHSF